MPNALLSLYNATRSRYLKLKARYDKAAHSSITPYARRRKRHLIKQLRKLYKRLLDLQARLRVGVGVAAFTIALAASAPAEAQSLGPFVKQSRSQNPLRSPIVRYDDDYIAAVDVDNDGDLDLAIGYQEFIRYYINSGTAEKPSYDPVDQLTGPFSTLVLGAEHYDFKPAFADLDEDGDMDMVLATNQGFYYCRNDDGKFYVVPDEPWVHTNGVPGATGNPLNGFTIPSYEQNPVFADYDGDGDLDLVLGHGANVIPGFDGYLNIDVWKNNNNESFSELPPEENPFFTDEAWHINKAMPRFADVDNDGDLDMIVGHYGIEASPGLITFINEEGQYEPDYNFNPFLNYEYNTSLEIADFDNDGDLDVLMRGSDPFDWDYQTFSYLENNGDFTFTLRENLQSPVGGAPNVTGSQSFVEVNPVFIDVDDDGDLDVFVGYSETEKYGNGHLQFFRYDQQTGEYILEPSDVTFSEGMPKGIVPVGVDWDDDGDTDMMIAREDGFLDLYLNEGNNDWTYTETDFGVTIISFVRVVPAFMDVDNDGDLDVFVLHQGTPENAISFFRNEGGDPINPTFELVPVDENPLVIPHEGVPPYLKMISTNDVDGDGWPDIVLSNYLQAPKVYLFTPGNEVGEMGTFALMDNADNPFSGFTNSTFGTIHYIDVDGDGDRDMYTGNFIPNDLRGAISLHINENPAPVFQPSITERNVFLGIDTIIDPNAVIIDSDNDVIVSATISLNNFEPGVERLLLPDPPPGISATFMDGVLYIVGRASIATYQELLREVRYRYDSPGGGRTNARTFSRTARFFVTDADGTEVTSPSEITLSHLNDAPVLSPVTNSTAYDNTAILIHNSITAVDPDDANLQSARVTFSSGYVNGEDVLTFSTAFGISGTFDATTGELLLTGDHPVSAYQATLRSIEYNNSLGSAGTLGPRVLLMTVEDEEQTSNEAQINILVAGNSPILSSSVTTVLYNSSTLVINNDISITDLDDTHLEGAVVMINAGFQSAEDRLQFTNTANITGSYDQITGQLTLTGTATIAEYETALESVTYENVSATPSKQVRIVSFVANDGTNNGNTLTVSITYPNSPPVVTPATASFGYSGGSVPVNPTLTITDDGATLQGAIIAFMSGFVEGEDELLFTPQNGITGTFNPSGGMLTLLGTASVANYQAALRSIEYRNTATEITTGARTIRFIVNDGTEDGNPSVITLSVANNPPELATTTGTQTYTSGDLIIDNQITVSDADNVNLASATIVIATGLQAGQDVLLFTNQNGISGSYDAATGTLSLTGSATVAQYQDALRSVGYRNNNSANRVGGPREITFTVSDGGGSSNTVTVTVNVQSLAPVIASASNVFYISGELVINSGITVTDADNTTLQSATVVITSGLQSSEDNLLFANQNGITGSYNAATGTLTLTGASPVASYQAALRSVRYSNSATLPSTADRVITFSVNDGANNATLPGNIVRVNKPPVIDVTPQQTYAQGNVAFPIASVLSDPDDNLDLSTLTIVSAQGANVIVNGGVITIDYSNLPDYKGFDDITITVCDTGGRCETTTITIEVGAQPVIYTGMSPNGDGVNDFFFVRFAPPGTQVVILNRWGDILFQTDNYDNNDPANRFEGKNKNGTELIDGIYFYKVKFPDKSLPSREGSLIIKR